MSNRQSYKDHIFSWEIKEAKLSTKITMTVEDSGGETHKIHAHISSGDEQLLKKQIDDMIGICKQIADGTYNYDNLWR